MGGWLAQVTDRWIWTGEDLGVKGTERPREAGESSTEKSNKRRNRVKYMYLDFRRKMIGATGFRSSEE